MSLDQARALDAWARFGPFQRAAEALHKGHTAVLYAVRTLEEQAGIELVDRTGYRSRLTPAGLRVLEQCRKLLATERELEALCAELRGGWEPSLKVVFDGVFPAAPILRVVGELAADKAPTRIEVAVAFLARVEETFERDQADFMITVLPPEGPGLSGVALPEIRARLVAHRKHPAARHHKRSLTPDDLAAYVLVTVQGSDPRLQLATGPLERRSTVRLPDFHASDGFPSISSCASSSAESSSRSSSTAGAGTASSPVSITATAKGSAALGHACSKRSPARTRGSARSDFSARRARGMLRVARTWTG